MEDVEKELKSLFEEKFSGCFKAFFGNTNSAKIKCDEVLNLKCKGNDENDLAIYYKP